MAKKKEKNFKAVANGNKSKLSKYNSLGYLRDLNHICKLGHINESTKDWISATMLNLRETANCYEINFASFLIGKKIEFIHQAPFIFSGKIYFADFYIPSKHTIIELDGQYHSGIYQSEYDKFRDSCFNGNKIRVIRIPNSAIRNENELKTFLSPILKRHSN